VHRIVSAVDCGHYVNPGIIAAQLEAARSSLRRLRSFRNSTFENGRLQQTNFHTFPVMRMHECPEIETHMVENNEKSGWHWRAGSAVHSPGYRECGVRRNREADPQAADPCDGGCMKHFETSVLFAGAVLTMLGSDIGFTPHQRGGKACH